MSKSSKNKNKKSTPSCKIMSQTPSNFLGFHIYTPTIIAFIGYIVLAITIILPFEYPITDETDGSVYIMKYNFMHRFLMLLIMTIPIILSIYTINCMVGGNCVLWSYVVTIMTIIWIAIFVISAMVYTFHYKRDQFTSVKSEQESRF